MKRPVRIRMQGVVGAGGLIPSGYPIMRDHTNDLIFSTCFLSGLVNF